MNRNGISIDESMAMVLDSIRERGGTATTSDVKQETPWDDNEQIKYRFRKLRDAGVLTIEDQGIDEDTGRRLPLRVELTEGGRELVKEHDIHEEAAESVREQQSLDERVGTLEEQMDKVRDDMWQLKSDVRGLRDDMTRLMQLADVPDASPEDGEQGGGVFDGAVDADADPDEFTFGE